MRGDGKPPLQLKATAAADLEVGKPLLPKGVGNLPRSRSSERQLNVEK